MPVVFIYRKISEMMIRIYIMESLSIVEVVDQDFISIFGQHTQEKQMNYYKLNNY